MNAQLFSTFILVLLVAITQTYSVFSHFFGRADQLKVEVENLRENLKRESLKTVLVQHEFDVFRQNVATLMPEALKKKDNYEVRNLASIVTESALDKLPIEQASSMFEKARKQFNQNLFEDSNTEFEKILDKYPDSLHIVDTYFLLIEGKFQLREYESCVELISTMVQKYPEHILTGYALLRLGRIYELNDRLEDAVDIYKTIQQSFRDPGLIQQASQSLKTVAL